MLKRILKILIWTISSLVIIFLLLVFLITLPPVQQYVINKVTGYVSGKTHSTVSIGSIGISFPKSITAENIYLDDLHKDTLLFAGKLEADLDMFALLKGEVAVNSIALSKATARLSRTEKDSLYNFSFIINAFAGDTSKANRQVSDTNVAAISISEVSLRDIHFILDDKYNGIYTRADVSRLDLKTNRLDFQKMNFDLNDLHLDGTKVDVTISRNTPSNDTASTSALPIISLASLSLENIDFNFLNVPDSQFISASTKKIILKNTNVKLDQNFYSADKLESISTSFIMKSDKLAIAESDSSSLVNDVKASIGKISLKQTSVSIDLPGTAANNAFDPEHLHLLNLNLESDKNEYTSSVSRAQISSLSFALSQGFAVKNFSADVLYSSHAIDVNDLHLKTNNSSVNGEMSCTFSSLDAFKDSIGEVFVKLAMSKTMIDRKEVDFFAPQLTSVPFFTRTSAPVTISCNITGPVKDLIVEKLNLTAGNHTSASVKGRVTGLPDAAKTYYNITDLNLNSTAGDVVNNIPANMLPQTIRFPEAFSLHGNFKGTFRQFDSDLHLESSFGNVMAKVNMQANEKFSAEVTSDEFNVGKLLKQEKNIGEVSLNLKADGQGFKVETANGTVWLNVQSAKVMGYTYHDFHAEGKIANQQFKGEAQLNDTNISLAFDGMIGFEKGHEEYVFTLDLKGANLQHLKLTGEDIRLAAMAEVNLKGNTVDNINGKAGVNKIIVVKDDKTYTLDSLLFATVNEEGKSDMSLKSAIIAMQFNGSIAPGKLVPEVTNHINRYFHISDSATVTTSKNNFTFDISIQNHPLIGEVLLPALKDFEPINIHGSFDGASDKMELNASMPRIDYNGNVIRGGNFKLYSDSSALKYKLTADELSSGTQYLQALVLEGEAKDNIARFALQLGDDEKARKLAFTSTIEVPHPGSMNVKLGTEATISGNNWNIPADNIISINKGKPLYMHLRLDKGGEMISFESKDSSNLEINFHDFELINFTGIIQKDTALAEGKLNGTFTLLKSNAFTSNATLTGLKIRSHPVGDLTVTATNSTASLITLEARLTGEGNDLTIGGTITPKQTENALNLKLNIQNLEMKSIEGFSFGQLQQSTGKVSGSMNCAGTFSKPLIHGELHFTNVTTTPTAIQTPLTLKNETLLLNGDEIRLNSFTILDRNNQPATMNGTIGLHDFTNPDYNLTFSADHFMVMNSDQQPGQDYFGTAILNSRIKISGNAAFTKINADVKLDDGSHLGIVIPESKLTSDRGEGVVVFSNTGLNPILATQSKSERQKTTFRNLVVSADISVDKNATLKILVDQASGDSLVVRGDAALSFTMDPGGTMSLTGRYELQEGSYLVSLQDLVKKRFIIEKGSTISWNGDPMDADVDMRAVYTVRTSPIDLVASQLSGLGDAERNKYKERIPFEVVLKLKGQLLKPDIAFEIQLPPESRGAMGGAVYAKINQLNEDESELNKQVFALLVLNRFIQEDPLASENGSGAAGIARQSVGRFLSQQLNQWSSRYINGVELNFDVQSYEDYSSGQGEGRTEVGIGLKKQFNDRFSVQVGGSADLEGERTKQNNLSDLTGDIMIEYKLTEDGRYRLRGFRQNEYEGIIEGQLTETGAGIIYTKDFDRWRDLFTKPKETEQQ